MSSNGQERWFVRHADLIYKLILVGLIGLWVAFPPHASQPSVAKPQSTVATGSPT
jgi:hypothetical protein